MLQQGMLGANEDQNLDAYFEQQKTQYIHLEKHACEDWIAEDENEKIVGWARSLERDGHLQLTHFFVSTTTQGGGVGRELLNRAFPLGRGHQRSILATINPRALALYLQYDVVTLGMAFTFEGRPQDRPVDTDLDIIEAERNAETLASMTQIDHQTLGYRRPEELELLMSQQPVFLFYRQDQLAGYAFGYGNHSVGPAASLVPEDMPAILAQIEASAVAAKADAVEWVIPAAAEQAVRWALDAGYHIHPFHEVLLAKHPVLKLDRYLITASSFFW